MKSVAIIGAGITGLTAAFRLQQKQIPVTVYEATHRVGGVIQSVRSKGYLAEFGPNTILEISPKITDLIRQAGLEKRLLYSDEKANNRYLVRYRRTIAMPSSPGGFFSSKLFTAGAKFALLLEPFIRRWNNAYEESVADLVLRRLGREFLDIAIDSLVAGIYAGDPAKLSVQHAFPKLYALEQRYGSLIRGQIFGARERRRRAEVSKQDAKKISFDEGLQVLPDTLQARLGAAVHLKTTVTALTRQTHGWQVTLGMGGEERNEQHAAVLLAAPAYRLAEIALKTEGIASLQPLSEINYPPVVSVVLGFRRSDVAHPLDGFGMLIPRVENFHILGTLFSSSLFPGRAPEGHVTLTSYAGGMRNPSLASRDPSELYALTLQDLRVLLGITGQPTFQNCVFYPRAIPQYEVGYGRFKEFMDVMETSQPGLFFAGHYRHGISISDSLLSGYDAADCIEAKLK